MIIWFRVCGNWHNLSLGWLLPYLIVSWGLVEVDPPLVVTGGPAVVLARAEHGQVTEVVTVTEEEEERLKVPDLICQELSHLSLHQVLTESFHQGMDYLIHQFLIVNYQEL